MTGKRLAELMNDHVERVYVMRSLLEFEGVRWPSLLDAQENYADELEVAIAAFEEDDDE